MLTRKEGGKGNFWAKSCTSCLPLSFSLSLYLYICVIFHTKIGFLELLLELSSVPSIYPSSFISNPSSIPPCPEVKGQL